MTTRRSKRHSRSAKTVRRRHSLSDLSSWKVGEVSPSQDHFLLTYSEERFQRGEEVARVGRERNALVVQFLTQEPNVIQQVTRYLDFFVSKGEKDLWQYLHYYCGSTANGYAKIHWETPQRRFDEVFQLRKLSDLPEAVRKKFQEELEFKKRKDLR